MTFVSYKDHLSGRNQGAIDYGNPRAIAWKALKNTKFLDESGSMRNPPAKPPVSKLPASKAAPKEPAI